jgi:sialate O-acetylesterase
MSLAIIGVLTLSWSLSAAVKLPKIFGDNMVLQRDMPVPVWGWADKGEKVTVSFGGQEKTATAGEDGKWMVKLDPLKGSKVPAELKVTGTSTVVFKNVVVGEVWICSGQSNMEFSLGGVLNAKEELAAATNPLIRHIKFSHIQSFTRLDDLVCGPWVVCSPQTAGGFTAIGYFFAKNIVKELDLPIGLIGTNWGGTRIEPWTCTEGFKLYPDFKNIVKQVEEWDSSTESGRAKYAEYVKKLKEWTPQAEKALTAKQSVPEHPDTPFPSPNPQLPTVLYNAMINPIVPFAIRGAIWYQGESNGNEGIATYLPKMKALIEGWRQVWKQGDFPFYHVQLANFQISNPNNPDGGDGYAKLREAQFHSLCIKNTGMAVIIDIGEARDIHPKDKQDVGARLALWALAKDYPSTTLRAGGKAADLVYSGPLYKSFKVEGNKIRIEFDHADSGLFIGEKKGLEPAKEIKNGKLGWISIAGEDKKFHFADAVIDGKSLVVSCDKVAKPAAVRYHFTANPEGLHLYNKEGLPATPFRTDTW